MADSIRQFMQDMIDENAMPMSPSDENYQLPDKATDDFSLEELQEIVQHHPLQILTLFDRSGWILDDQGRIKIREKLLAIDKEEGTSIFLTADDQPTSFEDLPALQQETVICFKTIVYTNLSDKIYEGLHVYDKRNPIKGPKFASQPDYETLVIMIHNPHDNVALVMNTLTQLRVLTSIDRAERFYLGGFIEEMKLAGVKLLEHRTEVSGDDGDKIHIVMYGHIHAPGQGMVISQESLVADAAMDKVRSKLRNEILGGFRQEDDGDDDDSSEENRNSDDSNDDDDDDNGKNNFSANLNFGDWKF